MSLQCGHPRMILGVLIGLCIILGYIDDLGVVFSLVKVVLENVLLVLEGYLKQCFSNFLMI